ncbi:MAG: hypothetical protein OQK82_06600 [Candidatus Pacearchaeota archaeon]|nr:hypothetical protein [Candidatus Pacearchaeota archaeon]
MNLESEIENRFSMKKIILDSALSLSLPFYNSHLIRRAENNLGENGRKSLKVISTFLLAVAEVGFLYTLYSIFDEGFNQEHIAGLMVGIMGRYKGIPWGILKESDSNYYNIK